MPHWTDLHVIHGTRKEISVIVIGNDQGLMIYLELTGDSIFYVGSPIFDIIFMPSH